MSNDTKGTLSRRKFLVLSGAGATSMAFATSAIGREAVNLLEKGFGWLHRTVKCMIHRAINRHQRNSTIARQARRMIQPIMRRQSFNFGRETLGIELPGQF